MKKLAIILFFVFILTGCASGQPQIPNDKIEDVSFASGIYFDKNWDDDVGTYQGTVVPDKETALVIATAIFEPLKNTYPLEDFVPQTVFYDEEDSIWIVSFWEDSPQESEDNLLVITGYSCSIAFRAEDGRILRIWFGE